MSVFRRAAAYSLHGISRVWGRERDLGYLRYLRKCVVSNIFVLLHELGYKFAPNFLTILCLHECLDDVLEET